MEKSTLQYAVLGLAILTGALYGALNAVTEVLPEPTPGKMHSIDSWPRGAVDAYAYQYAVGVHLPALDAMDGKTIQDVLDQNQALLASLPNDHPHFDVAARMLGDQASYLDWLLRHGLPARDAVDRLTQTYGAGEQVLLLELDAGAQAFYEIYETVAAHASQDPSGSLSLLSPRYQDFAAGMLSVMARYEEIEGSARHLASPHWGFFHADGVDWPNDVEAFLAGKSYHADLQSAPRSPRYAVHAQEIHALDGVAYWLTWARGQGWTGLAVEYYIQDDDVVACGLTTMPSRQYCPVDATGLIVLRVEEDDAGSLGVACHVTSDDWIVVARNSETTSTAASLHVDSVDATWQWHKSIQVPGEAHVQVIVDAADTGWVVVQLIDDADQSKVAALGFAVEDVGMMC